MRERMEARLAELRAEAARGEQALAELDARRAELGRVMLRISGAVQVLEETLAADASAPSAAPATDGSPADRPRNVGPINVGPMNLGPVPGGPSADGWASDDSIGGSASPVASVTDEWALDAGSAAGGSASAIGSAADGAALASGAA